CRVPGHHRYSDAAPLNCSREIIMARRLLLLACFLLAAPLHAEGPSIQVIESGKAIEVRGISADDLAALGRLKMDTEEWTGILLVCVDRNERDRVPMFGSHAVIGDALRFTPRFPLTPGIQYRVVFTPGKIPGRPARPALDTTVMLPRPIPKATTTL